MLAPINNSFKLKSANSLPYWKLSSFAFSCLLRIILVLFPVHSCNSYVFFLLYFFMFYLLLLLTIVESKNSSLSDFNCIFIRAFSINWWLTTNNSSNYKDEFFFNPLIILLKLSSYFTNTFCSNFLLSISFSISFNNILMFLKSITLDNRYKQSYALFFFNSVPFFIILLTSFSSSIFPRISGNIS